MRRVLIASSNRMRLDVARTQLTECDPREGLMVVASSQRAADDIVRQHQGPGTIGIVRTTLGRLAQDGAEALMAERGLATASGLASTALAHRAAARVRTAKGLTHLEPVADFPGFGRALSETLSRLRTERITPAQLTAARPSGADLARILEEHQLVREEAGLVDETTLFDLAREAGIEPAAPTAVFIDVVPENRTEREFLADLLKRLRQVTALIPRYDEEGRHAWEELLHTKAVPLEPDDHRQTPLARARTYLFSADRPPVPPDSETPSSSSSDPRPILLSASSEGQECVQIARRVLELTSEGIVFDQMAVLLRNPTRTQPLIEDAFDRARIPFFCTRGARRPHPAGRAFLSLLSCAREGLSATRFAEYLSLDQFPRVKDPCDLTRRPYAWAPPRDERQLVFASEPTEVREEQAPEQPEAQIHFPLTWERHLNDAAVIGGKDRWARRLSGYEAELSRRLELVAVDDEPRAEYLRRELVSLSQLQSLALPIIDLLDGLPKKASWLEWLERLLALAGLALREPEPIASAIAELAVMGRVDAVGLAEVERVLHSRLRDLREEPGGSRFGRVLVGTLDDAAARSFDIVFVPGLAEGLFPRRIFEDPLLLDAAVTEVSPELVQRPRLVRRERLLLHGALAAAERQVVLSCPRIDTLRGRARVPSFYALEVLEAADGHADLDPWTRSTLNTTSGELGWPAPVKAEDAIDEAEYDLATLGPLLRKDADEVRGRARYLVVNAQGVRHSTPLVRALETSWNRGRALWTEADGLLAPKGPAHRHLAEFALTRRTYSPTALQRFAACPYRFFLGSILRLAPREVPVRIDQLDPLTRGGLFHAVQFAVFGALSAKGLWPVTSDNLESGRATLHTTFETVANRWADNLAPALPGVWRRELEGLRLDLRRWLEASTREPEWRPIRAELAFGLDPAQQAERDPDSRARAIRVLNRYRIRGAIDWIERHEGTGHLRVTDHKTGRPPRRRPIYVGGGEHLQPVLYGLAARAMLSEPVDEGRLYYCTERGGFEVVQVPLDEVAEKRMGQVLHTIDTAVREGTLVAAPGEGKCRWCDYQAVCGPHAEERAIAKHPGLISALHVLREAP